MTLTVLLILPAYLIAHDPGEVLQQLLECAEFFGTDRDHGALEELVIVDEKSDLQGVVELKEYGLNPQKKHDWNRYPLHKHLHVVCKYMYVAYLSGPLLRRDMHQGSSVRGRGSRAITESSGHCDGVLDICGRSGRETLLAKRRVGSRAGGVRGGHRVHRGVDAHLPRLPLLLRWRRGG